MWQATFVAMRRSKKQISSSWAPTGDTAGASLLGSTANAVLHGTSRDVLCVHIPEELQPIRQVLVAVDGTDEARTAVSRAADIAALSGARLSMLSVVRPLEHAYAGVDIDAAEDVGGRFAPEAEKQVRARVDALADDFGVTGERLVRRGHPAEEIHAASKELSADLVPVGHKFGHVFYAAASKGCSLAWARSMRCSNESRSLRVNFYWKGWAMAS